MVLDKTNRKKLEDLNNPKVIQIVEKYIELCQPEKVTVITDSKEDKEYLRKRALEQGEEKALAMNGHTIHYDGINDQGRDPPNTKVLLPKGTVLSKSIRTRDKDEGLEEVFGIMDGIMKGKEMLVMFYCLGPTDSKFTIPALQLTDSFYVSHSEDMLYRPGYEQFRKLNGSEDFFHLIHSAGELDERNNSKNVDQRRIYIDLEDNRVLTVNNQYAGNSVGLKKLSLRLAINKSSKEDWLCEHMFISGVKALDKDRITYFTGAYPSACGKTSTAMVGGNTIIGDDIAYIKPAEDGYAYAVNVEQGIFGIIRDVNAKDDPEIFKALKTEREIIFSNILINDGKEYWLGMGEDIPKTGENYAGQYEEGKKDANGNEITPSHKNARFTLRISELENADPRSDDPKGVPVRAMIYGGRDSDTSVPVAQSLSWSHGVFLGAALESETTSATIGAEGQLKHNPMANIDFLVIPLGTYIKNHLKFGDSLANNPLIFTTNYFLKKDGHGQFLNEKTDKKVWLLWMEGRVHEEYSSIETPVGLIPKYDDLKDLFQKVFQKDYTKEEYEEQFSIRIPNLLQRLDRIEAIFKDEDDIPEVFWTQLNEQRTKLKNLKEKIRKDVVSPFELE